MAAVNARTAMSQTGDSDPQRTLPDRINTTTRPSHTKLNRLILARLPLSLPPHTDDPSTYACGLLHITPIYSTFEALWQSILDSPATVLDDRTRNLLDNLHLEGLARTARLKSDIRDCSGESTETVLENLEQVASGGKVAEFIAHTRRSVETNPHVLVAYAWVLYMALFAGGRYLRASLQAAGPEFWGTSPENPIALAGRQGSTKTRERRPSLTRAWKTDLDVVKHQQIEGLRFFHFDGEEDGEDIKRLFKERILEADLVLSEEEKEDVVREGQIIFTFMVEIVEELDSMFGTTDLPVGKLAKSGTALEGHAPGEHRSSGLGGNATKGASKSCPITSRPAKPSEVSSSQHLPVIRDSLNKLIQPLARTCVHASPTTITTQSKDDNKTSCLRFRQACPAHAISRSLAHSSLLTLLAISALLLWYYSPDFDFAFATIPTS